MKSISTKRMIATLILASLASVASAQYAWLDDRGVKQYSDVPPPSSVPNNRILKQPGKSSVVSDSSNNAAETPAKSALESDKTNLPLTTAEKNAEFQKRKAKQAEQEAKAAEDAKNAANKAKNCENSRNYHRSLTSGDRIATTDKNGERSFISDDQRAKEIRETQNILNDCR